MGTKKIIRIFSWSLVIRLRTKTSNEQFLLCKDSCVLKTLLSRHQAGSIPLSPRHRRIALFQRSKKRALNLFVLFVLTAWMAMSGVFLWKGFNPDMIEELPLPDATYSTFEETDGVLGNTAEPDKGALSSYTQKWKIHYGETGGSWAEAGKGERVTEMSVVDMNPNSVFLPRLGIYSEIDPSRGFVDSDYENFETLDIPTNPYRSGIYMDGAPMSGFESDGTTFIASHVGYETIMRGAYYYLHDAQPGDIVYTKDENGEVWSWVVGQLWHDLHTNFPEEYFSSTGPRRLVLTTCGGSLNQHGLYQENIFAVATPLYHENPNIDAVLGG